MDLLEILKDATQLAALAAQVIHTAQTEGRDPTAEEIAQVHALRKASEDRWAALAPKDGQ